MAKQTATSSKNICIPDLFCLHKSDSTVISEKYLPGLFSKRR